MLHNLAREFRLRNDLIYLNHAAVSPWPSRTTEAIKRFAEENLIEGSSHYARWLTVESDLRGQAANLLNAPSADDIALLKNTSEALSVVAYGLDWNRGDNIVSTNQEFPSNRIVWESLKERGVEFREADLNSGSIPEDAILAIVDDRTRLITVSSVQFSTGLRLDLEKLGKFCREHKILFCVDAIQSIGAVGFDVQKIQVDFVMADGHKWMFGPEGVAIFYSSPESRELLNLNQYGWHMTEQIGNFDLREWEPALSARRFECGSPNMLGIHALNASLSLLLEGGIESIEEEIIKRSRYLFDRIRSSDSLELITRTEEGRYAGIVTFRHKGYDNRPIYDYLLNNSVMCSLRKGAVRFSPHFYTTFEEMDKALNMIETYRPL